MTIPMRRPKPKICLCMIVKNEESVIARCLKSVIPFIDYWVIVDTGSTDNTLGVITRTLTNVSGMLHVSDWRGFAGSRNEALSYVPTDMDYVLFIDADEELITPPGYKFPELFGDHFLFEMKYGEISYWRSSLVSRDLPWEYKGVVHEYLSLHTPPPVYDNSGMRIDNENLRLTGAERGRRLDGPKIMVHLEDHDNSVEKYLGHAALLEADLQKDPENPRSIFYLAQSYRDAKQPDKAFEFYKKRAEMGGYNEEVWYSFYQCALLAVRLEKDDEEVLCWFLKAHNALPSRSAETLGCLCRCLNRLGLNNLAVIFGRIAVECVKPMDGLFIDASWYNWQAHYEYAQACYDLRQYETAARYFQYVMNCETTPSAIRVTAGQKFDSARSGIL